MKPKTCGECPWFEPEDLMSDVFDGRCKLDWTPAGSDHDECEARRAFRVVRDEVRRLRDEAAMWFHLTAEEIMDMAASATAVAAFLRWAGGG